MTPRALIRALVLLGGLLAAGPALAHAALTGSEPADGAVAAAPPDAIVLRFNEPVAPVSANLSRHDGAAVALQPPRVEGGALRFHPAEPLAEGGYLLRWRVVSADGHPIGGALQFAVGAMPPEWRPAAEADPREAAWWWAVVAVRGLAYAGLLLAAGGGLFFALVPAGPPSPELRRGLTAALLLAAAAKILLPGLTGALLTLAAPAELLAAAPWRAGVATLGRGTAVTLLGLLLLLPALARMPLDRWPGRMLAGLGGAAALAGLSLSGHAAAADPRWLATVAAALHALCAGFWAGALWPLLGVLRREPAAARALRRFSTLAVGAVGLLVATGLLQAGLHLGGRLDLHGPYGQLVVAKLLALATLLSIAVENKRALTPALAAGDATAAPRLARNIRSEIGFMAAVVAVTAALGATPPRQPGAHGHGAPVPVAATAAGEGIAARIAVSPGRAGHNTVTVALSDGRGQPLAVAEARLRLAAPGGAEPLERALRMEAPGRYSLAGPELAVPGAWTLTVEALVSDFERRSLTVTVPIQ
ncbi:MAG TPA: copper resistance protein CopC [Alphaproteobacteria bacterium]|nr:copper resistance protein CopC [Alphaproteobacteria bacterium]